MSNLTDNLKYYRKLNNLSQQWVSNYLNIARSTYNEYEKGLYKPKIDNLYKLATLYNICLDELYLAKKCK